MNERTTAYLMMALVPFLLFVEPTYAASTGMPWEQPLDQLLGSLSGPVARVIGAGAIIFLGLGLAFSEGGSFIRRALWVVMGLSLAFNAVSWGLGFMGFGGGLTI